jgi:prevent-host-death family protein
MHISVSEAKGQLSDLVRRAEAGDDVVLTRHGRPKVRLVVVTPTIDSTARQAVFDAIRAMPGKVTPGPCAARSQDFLYDEFGLPA